jgi:NADH dehydrogenase
MTRPAEQMDDHLVPRREVTVGGGFAGLLASSELWYRPVEVTVVDRAAHHVFQPLRYERATGVLSKGQVAVPRRGLFRRQDNVDCMLTEVVVTTPADAQVIRRRRATLVDLLDSSMVAAIRAWTKRPDRLGLG